MGRVSVSMQLNLSHFKTEDMIVICIVIIFFVIAGSMNLYSDYLDL